MTTTVLTPPPIVASPRSNKRLQPTKARARLERSKEPIAPSRLKRGG